MVCANGVCIPTVGLFPLFMMLFKRVYEIMCHGFRFVEGTGGGFLVESPASAAKKYQAAVQARYPAVVPAFSTAYGAAEAIPAYGSVVSPATVMATPAGVMATPAGVMAAPASVMAAPAGVMAAPASVMATTAGLASAPIATTIASPALGAATVAAAPAIATSAIAAPAIATPAIAANTLGAATFAAPALAASMASSAIAAPALATSAGAIVAPVAATQALTAPAVAANCCAPATLCVPATVCGPAVNVPCSPIPCAPGIATVADATTVLASPTVASTVAAAPVAVSPLAASPVAVTQSALAAMASPATIAASAPTTVAPMASMASVPIAGAPATLAYPSLAASNVNTVALTGSPVAASAFVPSAVTTGAIAPFTSTAYTASGLPVSTQVAAATVLPLAAAPVAGTANAALAGPYAADYASAAFAPSALYQTTAYGPAFASAADRTCCRPDNSCYDPYTMAATRADAAAAARYMREAEVAAYRAEKAAHQASAPAFRARRHRFAAGAESYMPSAYAETPFESLEDIRAYGAAPAYATLAGPVSPAYLPYAQATRGASHMAAAGRTSKLAYGPAGAAYGADRAEHAYGAPMPYHTYEPAMGAGASMVGPAYSPYGYRIDTDVVPEPGCVVEIPSKTHFARFMARCARQVPQKVVCGYVGEDNGPSKNFEELLARVARTEPSIAFCQAKPECAFRGTHISATPCLVCYGFDQDRQAWVEQARVDGYDAPKIHATIIKFTQNY